MTFPEDDNGAILTEMAEAGLDFSVPYQVDFYAAFEFEDKANEACETLKSKTFAEHQFANMRVQVAEEGGGFELVATLEIMLEHKTITDIDLAFTVAVEKLKGYADGWGVEV